MEAFSRVGAFQTEPVPQMPFAVIFAASDECKESALADGFKEHIVLIKHVLFDKDKKWEAERDVRKHKPYQFAVTDFWGMMPD